ncbi:MAG: hypothetical protein IJU52_08375 [Clostridia bacterium]|nr:hypothetical protein [Clostridia bacterium]
MALKLKKEKGSEKIKRLQGEAEEEKSGFSYDPDADALYRYYKDAYEKSAEKSMKDTVGKIASLSGGYASSYAQSAGQGAYDRKMAGLNEVIPSLYKLAYERYSDERDRRDRAEKEAFERQREESRYADKLAQQAYENELKERSITSADADKAWERAFEERKYGDRQAEKEALSGAPQDKTKYDYFDERLFAGMELDDAEKKLLDDAGYRYMKTGSEKWLDEAAKALSGKDAGDYFDFMRALYERAQSGAGKTEDKKTENSAEEGKAEKEMTAAQVQTYLGNRDKYVEKQAKETGSTEATRSFALYLKAQMRQGFFSDPTGEVTAYIDAVVGPPDVGGIFDAGALITAAASGAYTAEQKRLYVRLLDVFESKGVIGDKEKAAILKSKGIA